jgi:hypothetical protein
LTQEIAIAQTEMLHETPDEHSKLFHELNSLDKTETGHDWDAILNMKPYLEEVYGELVWERVTDLMQMKERLLQLQAQTYAAMSLHESHSRTMSCE